MNDSRSRKQEIPPKQTGSRRWRRIWMVGIVAILVLATISVLWGTRKAVKIINHTPAPLENVLLSSGIPGEDVSFDRIEPGQAAWAYLPERESAPFSLSYEQPAGRRQTLPPLPYLHPDLMQESVIRVGIIVDPRGGGGNDFYFGRRRIYDPARLFER